MAWNEKAQTEVTTPQVQGVSVDHPAVAAGIKQMAKNGVEKERAMKLSGMPHEVVDRYYQEAKREK